VVEPTGQLGLPGEPAVLAGIQEWAALTLQARDLIVAGRGHEIGPLMNRGFDLRRELIKISEGNLRLIETGRKLGASTQFAGSGGAIIGTYDGEQKHLNWLKEAYAEFGAKVIVPEIK